MAINGKEQENDKLVNAVKVRKQQAANAATSGRLANNNQSANNPLATRSKNNFRPGFNAAPSGSSSEDSLDDDDAEENANNSQSEDKSDDLSSSSDNSGNSGNDLGGATAGGLDEGNGKADLTGEGIVPKGLSVKIKLYILAGAAVIFSLLIVIVLIFGVLTSVGDAFKSFITNAIDGFVDFFTKDQAELEIDYYTELKNAQMKIYNSEKICIDANLITAALTVEAEFNNNNLNARSETQIDPEEEDTEELEENGSALDYKRMKKQIALLAAMQVKHKRYAWDTRLSTGGGYCKPSAEGTSYENVTADNEAYAKIPPHLQSSEYFDSSTPEKVAENDLKSFFNFLRKRSSEEKNFEYSLYQPAADRECVSRDNNGNCVAYGDVCHATTLPSDEAVLSIGEESDILNTMEDGVFYWNLINSFVKNYYKDILPVDEGQEREDKIKEIATSIYQLYADMGPSHDCSVNVPTVTYDSGNLCPDGITVVTKDKKTKEVIDITTHDFEEYVAGVVAAENPWYEGDNIESAKAQAIAARSYAIAVTNYCQKTIENGESNQAYKPTSDPHFIRAAEETKGIIVKKNGRVFMTEYDAFCVQSISGDIYTIKQKSQQIPKSFVLDMGSRYAAMNYCYGHGRGMSQIGARYLQRTGSTYDQILTYYYGGDIELSGSIPDAELTPPNSSIITKTAEEELLDHGYTLEEFNNYIAQSVNAAGFGTREGVVAAAVSMINGFYDRTGKKLNYAWGGDRTGRYGIGGDWKQPPASKQCYEQSDACYYRKGLDCAAFVSWALHNGGFVYESNTSTGRNNSAYTDPHPWPYTEGKPGDLLSTKYDNGGGHIQLIVGVTDTGYILAHAGSYATGISIHSMNFTTTCKNCTVIGMDKYYANYPKAQR